MALPGIGLADPQRRHRAPAEHGGRVHRLAAGHAGKAPASARAQVARALRYHGHLGAQHVPGGQQAGVHGDRLQVATERLAGADRARQPARRPQPGRRPGEPGGQRTAVQHHVRGGSRARLAEPGENGRQGRVQVRHDDRHPAQVVRVAEHLVVRRALLVRAGHAGLHRRVPGLDQVPGARRAVWKPVRHGDHQGITAGAEPQFHGRGVEQNSIARLRPAGQRRVSERPQRPVAGGDFQLDRSGPLAAHVRHYRIAPSDHPGRVTWPASGGAAMSRRKTERLLSLVVCLLSSQRYLSGTQIRAAVPGYPDSFDAFKRMFERDKEELRDLGIPLDMGTNGTVDEEVGYRIPRQAYVLPDITLEPDEAAVLAVAARVWHRAELAGAAAGALLKLRAAGVEAEEAAQPGIEPRLQAGEAAFAPLWEAVRDRRPVTFRYRAAGRSEAQRRELEPWGVVNRHGRWYAAGHDRARQAVRAFRLSRIDGRVEFCGPPGSVTVPADTDVRELVRSWDDRPVPPRTAVLGVRAGAGLGIRRQATREVPGSDGWDEVELPFAEVAWFSEHLASFGPDVVVREPADLRDAVITRLKGALA